MERNKRCRTGWLLASTGGALILALTLWPGPEAPDQKIPFWCILCGSQGLAAGFLNVLLFMPLGAGLGLIQGPWLALAGSFALSGSVEFAQTFLPGRFPTLSDLLANSAGGLLGALVVTRANHLRHLIVAPPRHLRFLTLLAPAAVFLATSALSSPRFPDSIYYGQWARELGRLQAYPGIVLEASVGRVPVPDVRIPQQDLVREAMRAGEPLEVTFIAGPEPHELSHLFAIFDDHQRGIVMLMVEGDDLVFQRRALSAPLRLDQPSVRWWGGLTVPEGDTVRIRVWQGTRDLCLEIDARVRCDLSPGVEGGWRLIRRLSQAPPLLVGLLGVVWLMLLSLPAGLTAPGPGRAVLLGTGLAILGALLSWHSPWLSVSSLALGGPILGAWVGFRLRQRIIRQP